MSRRCLTPSSTFPSVTEPGCALVSLPINIYQGGPIFSARVGRFFLLGLCLFFQPTANCFKKIVFLLTFVSNNQCCGSGMIYSGSGFSFECSEFRIRIQAHVPDPCGSGPRSNLYYLIIFRNNKNHTLNSIKRRI